MKRLRDNIHYKIWSNINTSSEQYKIIAEFIVRGLLSTPVKSVKDYFKQNETSKEQHE